MPHPSRATSGQKGGRGKSANKRKLPSQSEGQHHLLQQGSLSKAFFKDYRGQRQSSHSPSASKRFRLSPRSPPYSFESIPVSSEGMYNFTDSGQHSSSSYAVQPLSSSAGQGRSSKAPFSNAIPRQSNFTPHTGAKKLVVKNLRTGSRLDQDSYFRKIWTQIDTALVAVFSGAKPETSLEELYKGAENVCRQGKAAALAKKLRDKCLEYVSGHLRRVLLARISGGSDIETLRAVVDAWTSWQSKLITVRWIFYYLDQSFLLHSKDFPVIREMGLMQFRSHIFADHDIKPKILRGAIDLIQAERDEDGVTESDPSLLRNSIEFLHGLDVYVSEFEPLFIWQSRKYFSWWAQQEAAGYIVTFVERSHRLVEREATRCELYSLNRSTKQQLSELLDEALVVEQEAALLNERDIHALLRVSDKVALKQLYSLLNRKGIGAKLKPAFSAYIIEEGSGIVFDEASETDMVARLLEFKQSLDDTWSSSFNRNEELGHALREAFETFMNKTKKSESTGGANNPRTGEMIAKYVDRLLKGGWKLSSSGQAEDVQLADEDAEINRQLDQVLDLFRFVHGKAVFEAFYKNDLARRLLMGRSANDDAEKSMLARLRTECGSNFTHNLESMFKDMDVARDEMTSYNSIKVERKHRLPVDLHVNVLSSGSWPSYPDVPVRMPHEVMAAINDFQNYYYTKHSGRKLVWKHQLAHCQLRARFPAGNKELVVSSFQAIVLLQFNDVAIGESRSYSQIQEATGLSDAELSRTLQSLACAKYRVLRKRPRGREVSPSDSFVFNERFSDAKMRIKINQIQLKETREENKTTHERVAADRHYETQAAIVRIMKSRKRITHAELIAEVIKATRSRGVLEPAEIKKNIEKLIEKDYMEREEGNSYQYLA